MVGHRVDSRCVQMSSTFSVKFCLKDQWNGSLMKYFICQKQSQSSAFCTSESFNFEIFSLGPTIMCSLFYFDNCVHGGFRSFSCTAFRCEARNFPMGADSSDKGAKIWFSG